MHTAHPKCARFGVLRATLFSGIAIAAGLTPLAPQSAQAAGAVATAPGGGSASGINYGGAVADAGAGVQPGTALLA